MTKNVLASVRWVAGLTALIALAGCNFENTWTGSIKEPGPGANPPIGGNPNHPPTQPGPDDNLPEPGTGNATLAWIPPLENTDGSPLQDLTGYRIHYGTQSGNYEFTIIDLECRSHELRGRGPGARHVLLRGDRGLCERRGKRSVAGSVEDDLRRGFQSPNWAASICCFCSRSYSVGRVTPSSSAARDRLPRATRQRLAHGLRLRTLPRHRAG